MIEVPLQINPEHYEILIVDDNPENLKVLGSFLYDQGFTVRAARDGKQALESVALDTPDLILLDIHMPVLDGYETCRTLKSSEAYSDIPVIFLSALGETFNKVRAFELGGADYIVKPFELEEVRMRVANHLLANRLLAESKAGFRASFEQAAVGMAHLDLDGRILVANRRLGAMLGHQDDDLVGGAVSELFGEELGACALRRIGQVRDGNEETMPGELCMLPQGESPGWCNASFFPVEISANTVPYVAMIVEDVTRQMQLEKQLRQSQKMEAIGTLASGIAHDFNNLLTAISGYTELALCDLPVGTEMHGNLREVSGAADRARELVRQILAFGRKSELQVRPVHLQELIREVLQLIRRTVSPNVEIRDDLQADCPPVLADATVCHQILMNLCTNAYHAMEESGGVLTVALSHTLVSAEQLEANTGLSSGAYVRIDVSDTGYGMDEDTQQRIFEPYYTTKERSGGTGLGLAMVHGIVGDLKGDIHVHSELGAGSTFTILLPATEEPAEFALPGEYVKANAETGSTNESGNNERVLFVDDDRAICRFAEKLLLRLGYQVTARSDPFEALKLFRAAPTEYDVIITDDMMPEVRGSELLAKVRSVCPDTPVILYSGFSEEEGATIQDQSPFEAHMMKPMVSTELAKVLRDVLNKS